MSTGVYSSQYAKGQTETEKSVEGWCGVGG